MFEKIWTRFRTLPKWGQVVAGIVAVSVVVGPFVQEETELAASRTQSPTPSAEPAASPTASAEPEPSPSPSKSPSKEKEPSPKPDPPQINLNLVRKGAGVVCEAAELTSDLMDAVTAALNRLDMDSLQANAILLSAPAGSFVYGSKLFRRANADDLARVSEATGKTLRRISTELIEFSEYDDTADPPFDEFERLSQQIPQELRKLGVKDC